MKKKILLLIVSVIIVFSGDASGYDNMVIHPRFARNATEIYNQSSIKPLTAEQVGWIIAGAVKEDADPRYLRHFYDFRTGSGFGVWPNAASWTQKQDTILGDFSESAILNAYKEGDEQLAYIGVGHQVHIIEDMAVPAHVRNDPHNPDPYEDWCQKNSPDLPQASMVEITNLSDAIINFAKQTGANFYSQDSFYDNISYSNEAIMDGFNYEIKNGYVLVQVKKFGKEKEYFLDPKVHQDYFTQLAPKAVGYSAGVIDFFQKKFAVIDEERKKENKVVAFFQSISNLLTNPFAGIKVAYGDIINSANINLQINGNQAVQDQLASNSQLKEDITTAAMASDQRTAKAAIKTSKALKEVLKKAKVLGEKIVASSTPGVFTVVPGALPVGRQSTPPDGGIAKKSGDDKIVFDIIPPAKADVVDDPDLAPPVRTAPWPTFGTPILEAPVEVHGAPANSEPIVLPEPLVYPETVVLSQPLSLGNSKEAIFVFGSDLASSTFEFTLDDVSSTTEWHGINSIITLEGLADGPHTLTVRAVYKGVTDQTPASYSWLVDTVAPVSKLTALAGFYTQTAWPISWSRTDSATDEALFNLDYAINGGEWQSLETATSAMAAFFSQDLNPGDQVGFRLQACDVLGNCEAKSTLAQAEAQIRPDHLVISALQTSGVTAKDESIVTQKLWSLNLYAKSIA